MTEIHKSSFNFNSSIHPSLHSFRNPRDGTSSRCRSSLYPILTPLWTSTGSFTRGLTHNTLWSMSFCCTGRRWRRSLCADRRRSTIQSPFVKVSKYVVYRLCELYLDRYVIIYGQMDGEKNVYTYAALFSSSVCCRLGTGGWPNSARKLSTARLASAYSPSVMAWIRFFRSWHLVLFLLER